MSGLKLLSIYTCAGLLGRFPGFLSLGPFSETGHLGGPAQKMKVFLEADFL